jgi:ABC-type methionine transport system ATPase subunit
MANQIIVLTYPASLLRVPVINQLIRKFEITVNIIRAQVDSDQGWIEVQLTGAATDVEEALVWLKSQGVDVNIKAEL